MIGLLGLQGFIPHPYQILQQINQERTSRLNVPAVLLLKERLDHLTAFILGAASDEDQLNFEWGYETNIAQALDAWEAAQRRSTLTEGLSVVRP